MGTIARQSFYNILSILFAFALGGVNTVVFYPRIMGPEFHGLIVALLANSNIIQPLFSYGIHFTIIKYYSACKNKFEQDNLLVFSLILPLIIILPTIGLVYQFDSISSYVLSEDSPAGDFLFLIFSVAVATAYFEIFYSWLRIQKKTVFGNFLKEVYQRIMISVLLVCYLLDWLDFNSFTQALIVGYYLRLLIIFSYALWVYRPEIHFAAPRNIKSILRYCSYVFLSGFSASIILDLDKSMIEQLITSEYVSYYTIAIFIAAVIDAPSRAMVQIVSPLVAEALNTENKVRLEELLKKSALNLFLVSGLLFVLITTNLDDLYHIIELLNAQKGYAVGLPIILLISCSKLFSASLGCLNNIITNSEYYRYLLLLSIGAASLAVVLNLQLIQSYGFVGAAIATLIVVSLFNFLKIALVYFKFQIHPFSLKSLWVLVLILALYVVFFNINLELNPFIAISIKSMFIAALYLGISYYYRISDDVNGFINRLLKKK